MKTSTHLKTLVAAGLIASVPMLGFAAANATKPAATASPAATSESTAAVAAEDKQILRSSKAAYQGMRDVQAARLAIFNGTPEVAVKMTAAAVSSFKEAAADAPSLVVASAKAQASEDSYIPFDMSMALAEGFVPSDDKSKTLEEANAQIAKGDQKKAAQLLALGNIDVTVSAAMLPVKASLSYVNDAEKLVAEKKFYQANLALKAIEDAVVLETFAINAVPAQGGNS